MRQALRRRRREGFQEMYRVHALGGVSAVAIPLALLAPADFARAQEQSQVLPPVTVEAPHQQPRAVRKPVVRTAATVARRPQKPAPAPVNRIFVPVAASPDQANSASL